MKHKSSIKYWRWLPGVAISIITLGILFRLVSWQDLKEAFSSIRPLVLVAGAGLTILSTLARVQTWRILLGSRPSFAQTFHIVNIGYLLNNILPFRSGELGRSVLMGRATGLGAFHVLSTIVIERTYDLAVACCFLLFTLPLALGLEAVRQTALAVAGVVALGLVCLFLAARFNEPIKAWITRQAEKHSFLQRVILPRALALLEGLQALNSARAIVQSLFWILTCWLLYVFVSWMFLGAFVPNPPFWWAFYLNGASALGVAVPAGPGSIGVFEATVVGALSLLQVSTSQALALGIALHFTNWVIMCILGAIGLSQLGYTLQEITSKVNQPEGSPAAHAD